MINPPVPFHGGGSLLEKVFQRRAIIGGLEPPTAPRELTAVRLLQMTQWLAGRATHVIQIRRGAHTAGSVGERWWPEISYQKLRLIRPTAVEKLESTQNGTEAMGRFQRGPTDTTNFRFHSSTSHWTEYGGIGGRIQN